MLALDNVVEDKVAYCAKYGFTIEPNEWRGNALPESILADRGEFEGYNVESLINSFGIIVHNTAPYRADWKSIVERHFGIATEKFIKYSPGGVIKEKERGDRDYRLDAIYTLHDFEALVIAHILNYNEAHELKYYRKDEFQIADEVQRFPNDLWDWGMENRTGHLQDYARDIVRLNLLPRKEVSVTEHGIHFSHQLYYTCETAEREGWFARARIRGSWKVSIAYHPHSTKHIYLPVNDGMGVEVCELTPASKAFENSDFFSVENYYFEETVASEDARDRFTDRMPNLTPATNTSQRKLKKQRNWQSLMPDRRVKKLKRKASGIIAQMNATVSVKRISGTSAKPIRIWSHQFPIMKFQINRKRFRKKNIMNLRLIIRIC